jgi:hypothetical protein
MFFAMRRGLEPFLMESFADRTGRRTSACRWYRAQANAMPSEDAARIAMRSRESRPRARAAMQCAPLFLFPLRLASITEARDRSRAFGCRREFVEHARAKSSGTLCNSKHASGDDRSAVELICLST